MRIAPEVVKPEYLGDGLYASFDGYQVRLFASDGVRVTNEVYLDPGTYRALMAYANRKWGGGKV